MSVIRVITLFSVIWLAVCDSKGGGKAPRLPLNDGRSIPALGLGTFLGFDEKGQKEVLNNEVAIPVTNALNSGYRLMDTAQNYKNEDQIGEAVRSSSVPREDIFIVTKLATGRTREPVQALQDSLKLMNLPYVDLYLIHFPIAFTPDHKAFDVVDYLDTWKAMEQAKKLGLTKSIGISNFNVSQIERLLANCEVKPAILQVEVQKGVVPIPKSTRKEKIEENINVFDFELTPEEMDTLSKFNKDYRTVWSSFWQDHPYYPFEKTDKPAPNIFEPKP